MLCCQVLVTKHFALIGCCSVHVNVTLCAFCGTRRGHIVCNHQPAGFSLANMVFCIATSSAQRLVCMLVFFYVRVLKKNPELIEQFIDKAGELVHDKNHAVMLSGVTLMLQICALDASALDKYRPMVPTLCKVLRSMLQGGFSPEHDVAGITNPFLQVKILQLLRVLGKL